MAALGPDVTFKSNYDAGNKSSWHRCEKTKTNAFLIRLDNMIVVF